MKRWHRYLKADPTPWLLEHDNPSVRYFALRDLLHRSEDEPQVIAAREAIMVSIPVREILEAQYPEGYWVKPDRGYSPKYRATTWQLIFLADLGATPNEAIDGACSSVLENSFLPEEGLFTATKRATGTIVCLNGNLVHAFISLGYGDHPTVREVAERLAEKIAAEGFECRSNAVDRRKRETWLPCAWGAVKALKAFASLSPKQRSARIQEATARGVDLLFSRDLTVADYPSRSSKVSPLWFQFGFPLGYTSDVLEAVDVLAQLEYGDDQRLQGAVEFALSKQDEHGRWPLERTLERTWTRFGRKGEPSKWVTVRALRTLSRLR